MGDLTFYGGTCNPLETMLLPSDLVVLLFR